MKFILLLLSSMKLPRLQLLQHLHYLVVYLDPDNNNVILGATFSENYFLFLFRYFKTHPSCSSQIDGGESRKDK
jgi:hypothetical protein